MRPRATGEDLELSLSDWRRIDSACDRFEAAWRGGDAPDPADYLEGASGAFRVRLLRELLAFDVETRLGRGESPDASRYYAAFPEDIDIIDSVFTSLAPDGPTLRPRSGGDREVGEMSVTTLGGSPLPRAELDPNTRWVLKADGYEILGELGRGGMGVVYLARKVALNRLCALKMILAGPYAGSRAAARFQAEAEAVARLRHPNIVQIYHVGEAGGLPYLELEYLPGGNLETALEGSPMRPDAAARLVEVLARAIAEAHRQGIVHRDLKPANILMDKEGVPKVADFGLAKILDSDTDLTPTRAVLGSPSYMAPEQAEGDIRAVGTESDVYALGAILYGLLTGRPPFLAATAVKTLALVKAAEPVPPSQLQPGLPRDVETICLKCLNKAPARRYASAEALAEDLRRFRAREPIDARPTPAWERAWKWSRRRPGIAIGLISTASAVLLLLVAALYYNARLRNAVKTARAAERAAESNARDALTQRNLALKAFNELVFNVQERLGDSPATRPLRKGLLDTAIAGLDEITRSTEASAPDLSRAVAHQKLGDIFHQVGRTADARRQLDQARRLAEHLASRSPRDLAIAECLDRACIGLGALSLSAGQYGEAKTYFRRVVDLSESITRTDPKRAGARRGLLEGYFQLGRAYSFSGELPEAEVWFRKMHDLAERWSLEEPSNTKAKDMLATSYRKLADVRKLSLDDPAAREDYLKAVAIGRELLAAEPGNLESKTNLATALNDLANITYRRRDFHEARPPYREAERLFSELVEADPENLALQIRLVLAQTDLGRLERDESRFTTAAELFGRALERLLRLEREGRLEGRPIFKTHRIPELREEIANCEAAPVAFEDLDAVRSRPPRVATRLLLIRAKLLSAQRRQPEFLATVEALCDLDVNDPEDCLTLARARAVCLTLLGASPDRSSLRTRCADRALAALDRAVALGFRDVDRLAKEDDLAPVRSLAGYKAIVDRLKDLAQRSK